MFIFMPQTTLPKGLIAKRRAASTLVSYLTPPVTHSDFYRHLLDLRSALDHWRQRPADIDQAGRAGHG
jgi:magnesium chelatase subunit H